MLRIYRRICIFVTTLVLLISITNIAFASNTGDMKETLMNLVISTDEHTMSNEEIDTIMNSLSYALEDLGVNPDSISMYKQSSEVLDLTWNDEFMSYNTGSTKYNADGIGDFAISDQGNTLVLLGNQCLQGKNAVYTIPVSDSKQTFTYDYKLDFGDSFNAGGLLVRVNRIDDTLTGYMISINNEKWRNWCGGAVGALWKFSFTKGTNSSTFELNGGYGTSIELIKPLNIDTEGTLTVTTDKKYIIISGGGLPSEEVTNIYYKTETNDIVYDTGKGFGLFSDHYNHNCERIGEFKLGNIKPNHSPMNYFSELINNLQWKNDGSLNLIIDINKYADVELNNPSELGEMLARCLNEDIHYLSWGPEESRVGIEAFIVNNNSNGMFIPFDGTKTSYDNSIDKTAKYIKDVLDIESSGRSGLNNSQKIIDVSDMKPIVSFKPNIDDKNIGFTIISKDIVEEQWKYKDISCGNSGDWIEGLPEYQDNFNYLVQLEVKDSNGSWSEPCIQNINSIKSKPIADFSSNGLNKSYSPNGLDIIKYDWEIKKDGNYLGTVSGSNYVIPDFRGRYGTGEYEYTLQVTDSTGFKSNPVTKIVNPDVFDKPVQVDEQSSIFDKFKSLPSWQYKLLMTLYLGIIALSAILGYNIVAYFLL